MIVCAGNPKALDVKSGRNNNCLICLVCFVDVVLRGFPSKKGIAIVGIFGGGGTLKTGCLNTGVVDGIEGTLIS